MNFEVYETILLNSKTAVIIISGTPAILTPNSLFMTLKTH